MASRGLSVGHRGTERGRHELVRDRRNRVSFVSVYSFWVYGFGAGRGYCVSFWAFACS